MFGLYYFNFIDLQYQNITTMKYINGFCKMLKAVFSTTFVLLWAVYAYGIIGFVESALGKNDRSISHYAAPLFWNFIALCLTAYLIFKK